MHTTQKHILMLCLLLIISACAGKKTAPPAAVEAFPSPSIVSRVTDSGAERDFLDARDAYQKGDAEAALLLARGSMDRHPGTPWHKRSLFLTEQALIKLDRTAEADAAMLRVQAEYPELADYGLILLADHQYAAARYSEAAALYEQLVVRYPASSLVVRASFKRGQALLESHAYPEAAAVFEKFLQKHPDSEFAPAAGLALGRALTAEADLARAARAYQDVWVRYPGDPNDREAEQELSMLRAGGVEVPEVTSAEWYERGRNLFQAKQYDKAVESFTKFLDKEPKALNRPNALYRTGVSLFYLGKRREAAVILEAMVQDHPYDERASEALYWLGKTYSRLSDWDRGAKSFERLLEEFPESEWCDDALFFTGNIYREAGDMEKAIRYYDRLVNEYPGSRYADSAIWWKAWWRYDSGDYIKAEGTLQELITRYPRSFLAHQARYWQGRASEKGDDPARAAAYYDQVLKKGPYTYYGYRAAERKVILGSALNASADAAEEAPAAFDEAAYVDDYSNAIDRDEDPPLWTEDMKQMLASDPSFKKILELVHLDMKPEAVAELWSLKDKVPRKRVPLMELSKVFFELEDYYHSLIIVQRGYDKHLDRPAPGMSDDLWLLAYPQGYWESILAYAGKYKQDPYFIAAIIREESQFRPDALSPVGARGLMQVMPATGEGVARQINLSGYDRQKLYDSDTAINIGTWYISQLMKQFRNNPVLVAAAYNAGPDAVQGWIARNGPPGEWDQFVEKIPFAETRRYVKKVLRGYAEYKRIYAGTAGLSAFGPRTAE